MDEQTAVLVAQLRKLLAGGTWFHGPLDRQVSVRLDQGPSWWGEAPGSDAELLRHYAEYRVYCVYGAHPDSPHAVGGETAIKSQRDVDALLGTLPRRPRAASTEVGS